MRIRSARYLRGDQDSIACDDPLHLTHHHHSNYTLTLHLLQTHHRMISHSASSPSSYTHPPVDSSTTYSTQPRHPQLGSRSAIMRATPPHSLNPARSRCCDDRILDSYHSSRSPTLNQKKIPLILHLTSIATSNPHHPVHQPVSHRARDETR